MKTCLIFKAAADSLGNPEPHRDDIRFELWWWAFRMAAVTAPGNDRYAQFLESRSRMSINCILERMYELGIVHR